MGSGVEPVPDPVLYCTTDYGTLILSDTDTNSVLIGPLSPASFCASRIWIRNDVTDVYGTDPALNSEWDPIINKQKKLFKPLFPQFCVF